MATFKQIKRMKENLIETLVGFIIIIIAASFLIFSYKNANILKVEDGYLLKANFQNVDGIAPGTDVMLSGIKIGYIKSINLDKNTFFAVVSLSINNDIKLPEDSGAAIVTSGLLGGRYLSITPGSSEELLEANTEIKNTSSPISLESLIGKLMYSFGNNK